MPANKNDPQNDQTGPEDLHPADLFPQKYSGEHKSKNILQAFHGIDHTQISLSERRKPKQDAHRYTTYTQPYNRLPNDIADKIDIWTRVPQIRSLYGIDILLKEDLPDHPPDLNDQNQNDDLYIILLILSGLSGI